MATINTFSVTNSMISAEFPDYDAFGASTSPTSTQVDRWIQQAAALVNGYLIGQGFALADVASDAVANAICQRAVIELTIVYCAPKMRGAAEIRAEEAKVRYEDWKAEIKANPEFLGDAYGAGTMGQGARYPSDQQDPSSDAQTLFSREYKPRNTQF